MLKSLAKNSFIYYLSTILTKGISFFLLPLYTSILSTEDYGVLELMSIMSTMVIILFTLQIGQGVARYYNELRNQKHIQIYSSTVAIFSLISFGVFIVISVLFLSQIAAYLNLSESTTIFALMSIALNGLFYLSQNQLTWKIKPFQEMISSLTYNILTIGSTIYFLVYKEDGISGIFKAQCIGAVLGILVAYLFTKKDYSTYFSAKVLRKLFRFSLPLLPGALAIFIYMFTDRICIKEMLGLDELGVFSVGNKIATILTFSGIGVSAALVPLIYRHFKEKETPEKIGLMFRLFSSLSFILLAFLAFFARFVIETMTNSDYLSAVNIVPFLLFAIYLNSLTFFFPGLSIAKKTVKISLIAILAGVINLILNIVLIPHFGILAAAIVTCVSFGLNFILLYHFSQKEYPINITLKPHFLVSVLFFAILFALHYFDLPEYFNFIGFIICSIASLRFILKNKDVIYIKKKIFGLKQ
jgi:O-antigen/teichoic acid export membrane protein